MPSGIVAGSSLGIDWCLRSGARRAARFVQYSVDRKFTTHGRRPCGAQGAFDDETTFASDPIEFESADGDQIVVKLVPSLFKMLHN